MRYDSCKVSHRYSASQDSQVLCLMIFFVFLICFKSRSAVVAVVSIVACAAVVLIDW